MIEAIDNGLGFVTMLHPLSPMVLSRSVHGYWTVAHAHRWRQQMHMVTRNKSVVDNTQKRTTELALKTSLIHTGHFHSEINNSLKISGHSNFELFFAVRYFRENTVRSEMHWLNT